MITLTCRISKMTQMNSSAQQEETHKETEQTCGCQGKEGLWGNGLGVWDQEMQTILYRMDKQQGPTNGTRNYIQYPVVNSNRKEYGKVYIWKMKSLCYIAKMNTTW